MEIDSEEYFRRLVIYIHQNPAHHGIIKTAIDYPYSSYHYYKAQNKSFIDTEKVLDIFGGMKNFKMAHIEMVHLDIKP